MHLADASKQAALIEIDVPQPEPREQEVLVRVRSRDHAHRACLVSDVAHQEVVINAPGPCHHMNSLVKLQTSVMRLKDFPSVKRSTA